MLQNKKSLGQHWLKNRLILDEIADEAAGFDPEESAVNSSEKQRLCLEIGPGLGTLTSSLLRRFEKVIAVEFDEDLARKLPRSFPGKNLEVVNMDFLKFDLSQIEEPYVVAGNIPYYITSPIIEKLITSENAPKRIVLLIQKEVAERILSQKESLLSLTVKNWAVARPGVFVPREEFTPPPKVDSQVIVLESHKPEVSDAVLKFIKASFVSPRKKLMHNLARFKDKNEVKKAFLELGFDENIRPSDLHLKDYQRLFENML